MKKWTDEMVKKELLESMGVLSIDRMPTAQELKNIGRNDLHCKISKTKKYSGWAQELGLDMKTSDTRTGHKYEEYAFEALKNLGYKAERMSTKFPYDILVNDTVKVDVKSGKVHYHFDNYRAFTFAINKKMQTCDLYILIGIDERDEVERIFVIPSHLVQMVTINIGMESKYNRFINAWDYVGQYVNFFETIK